MNCTDVAAVLDEHAQMRLTAAERCALDEHVSGCEPCAHAWRGQAALLALSLPPTPADIVACALRAMDARAPRRARSRVIIVGAVLAASAALAAVTAARLLERGSATSARSDAAGAAVTAADAPRGRTDSGSAARSDGDAPAIDVQYVDVEPFLVQRTPPVYPPDALARKLDGDVTLSFTIDEHGAVKDVEVVRSSDALFEATAIAALSQWKYLPRVSAGKRVAATGIQTIIRFMLEPPQLPSAAARAIPTSAGRIPTPDQPHYADFQAVEHGLAVAWQRVAADDLRGAELELDELRATYDLVDFQVNAVWCIYGYIYIQYGDYGRAIDAYEKAIASNEGRWTEPWTALANLYLARHQYDMALKTLLAYKQLANGKVVPEAAAMIERLRSLGVTEETL